MSLPIPSRGLIIRQPYAGLVASGRKTWEMRSKPTTMRGPIAIIASGTGHIIGVATLARSLAPIDAETMAETRDKHHIAPDHQAAAIAGAWIHPWVFQDATPLENPVPYRHRSGAVIWVRLDDNARRNLAKALQAQGG